MKLLRLVRTTWLIMLAGATNTAANAQTTGGQPESIFRKLFPMPTGANGYEELALAGELARSSKPLEAANETGATLAVKRRAMADPPVQKALSLLRAGLDKPIRSPRGHEGEPSFEAFSLMRGLSRLVYVEMYVLLADGRVSNAIESLRDGLRLGYALQSDMIIGGLVGVAMDAMVIGRFTRHVEQLADRDCVRLLALANEWMAAPDPLLNALDAERGFMLKHLGELTTANVLNGDEIGRILSARLDLVKESLRKPLWERKPLPPIEGDSPAAQAARALNLDAVYTQSLTSFAKEQAKMQVLGVHAAIRKYRWDNDRLPATLDELRLGRLAIDPFTGKPLLYNRTGETTYELTSEGLKPMP